jgi:hypothetical protein
VRQCTSTGATTQHEPHQQHRCDAAVCKRTSGRASRSTVDVVRTLTSWSLIVAMFQRGGVLTQVLYVVWPFWLRSFSALQREPTVARSQPNRRTCVKRRFVVWRAACFFVVANGVGCPCAVPQKCRQHCQ